MSGKLPYVNISVSLVAAAISESSKSVSGLVNSANVNRWGIFTPDNGQWNKFFGVPPTAGYPLGVFRGYEHDWRCYALNNISSIINAHPVPPISVRVTFGNFPVGKTEHGVTQPFTVWFSRQNNFHQGGGTIINGYDNNAWGVEGFDITFSRSSPPDGGTALTSNSVFYLKIKRNGSDYVSNNWDNRMSIDSGYSSDATGVWWIKSFTIPVDPFGYTVGISNVTKFAVNTPEGYRSAGINLTLTNTYPTSKEVNYTIGITYTDGTSGSISGYSVIPAATIDGGNNLVLGTLNISKDVTGLGSQQVILSRQVSFIFDYTSPDVAPYDLGSTTVVQYLPIE